MSGGEGAFWSALLHPNAHSAPFSKGNVSFLDSSHFFWVRPSVGIEFEGIGPIFLIMVELPCSHLDKDLRCISTFTLPPLVERLLREATRSR
jgi:hypothetical protein